MIKLRFMKALLLVLVMTVTLQALPMNSAYAADEYDTLRQKVFDLTTGGPTYDPNDPDISGKIANIVTAAQTNWDTMNKSAGRTYLWSDLATTTESEHVSGSYARLEAMTLAYVTRGSSLKDNAAMLADIISGMDWMYTNRYNTSVVYRGYDNWFDWQISSPLSINNITTWIYSSLTSTQITNWHAVIDYQALQWSTGLTGANRVWACNIKITSGIIVKNSAKIILGRDQLSPVFDYVTSGEGMYSDGSFLQHTALIAYNGGYGINLIDNLTKVMYIIAGSTWDITDSDVDNIFQWVYNAFEPLFYNTNMADMVKGRNISRKGNDDLGLSSMGALGASVARMALSAPSADDRAEYKSMVKKWMTEATSPTKYSDLIMISSIVQAKQIMSDPSVTMRDELVMNKQYPNMARAIHLRPGFAFGISMSSNKIGNYELINNENLKGWHTGDGMTYLYDADLTQYKDNYWPTVNSYRLPGTTVNQNTTATANAKNPNSWVGGTEISGLYGATGMQYTANGYNLSAKKSWFQFDDEIVSLGAGITSTDNKVVESIVENRKLNSSGNNALTVNGTTKSTALGWSETMTSVSKIHLAGNVAGSDVGYYFPTAATIKGVREARTDNWYSVNLSADPAYLTNYTRNYVNMWFDHGTNPTNGTYAYVTLPGKSSTQVDAYAANPDITVVENSADAQAVKENSLGILGINFWNDASKTVSGVTSNKKASVLVRTGENGTEVSVSDPTLANTGTIQLTLSQSLGPVAYKDSRITTSTSGGNTILTVNVNGAGGKSIKAYFATPTGVPVTGYTVNEDFNDLMLGDLTGQNGWIFNNAGVAENTVVVQKDNGSSTDKSLKVTTASTSGSADASRLFNAPQTGYITAEATVTADDINWKNALIISDNSLTSNNVAAQLVMQNGKIWGYNGSTKTDVLTGITSGQPYRLKVVLNASTKKYDVYVNDALLASGWNYRFTGITALDKFSTSIAGNASSMSVDDVKVSYKPLTITSLVDENFDGLTLGNLNGQGGWVFDNGGVAGNTGVVQTVSGSNKSAKLTTTSTSGKAEAYHAFIAPANSTVIAEATVTADDNNWKNALVISDSSLTSSNIAAQLIMQNGKIWGYNGGTQTNILTSTTNGESYRLKVIINTATKKFDVYVNGVLLGLQWNYRYSGLTKVDRLGSSIGGNASSMSVGNVQVSYIP
ncbi:polysaccharide lyase family 8 super-sandwich domain-containing protein [Paenibacillus qinlingensis]|uniref:Hyaluronate lyase n=1 Tax=Paenibacillus qinlingensis TaxID=1837343 RepID=A0ABU1NUF5_9BACL|nr:polysaccharide lyase family 8 super-sandwich domain-containing protein [Paenibacillus qinlingensis]MDR6550462.1 hypothetical protein [Paenibacillus qinlingensis]